MKALLNRFLSSLQEKGYFDEVLISEGIQDSYKIRIGSAVTTLYVAGNESLLTSSRHPGKVFHLKSPQIERILCRTILLSFGKPMINSSLFRPSRIKNGYQVYEDHFGREWVDSSFTVDTSLAMINMFNKFRGDYIELMMPQFGPMHEDSIKFGSSVQVTSQKPEVEQVLSNYKDYLFSARSTEYPDVGVVVGKEYSFSAVQRTAMSRVCHAIDTMFDNQNPSLISSRLTKDYLFSNSDFVNLQVGKSNTVKSVVGCQTENGVFTSAFVHNLDLSSILSAVQSLGYCYNDLTSAGGVNVTSKDSYFGDVIAVLKSSVVRVEPVTAKLPSAVVKYLDSNQVSRLMSAWGFNNPGRVIDSAVSLDIDMVGDSKRPVLNSKTSGYKKTRSFVRGLKSGDDEIDSYIDDIEESLRVSDTDGAIEQFEALVRMVPIYGSKFENFKKILEGEELA